MTNKTKFILHQTHHLIADFSNKFDYLTTNFSQILQKYPNNPTLHLYPELFLTGYPLQDLCLQRSFISSYQEFLEEITEWSKQKRAVTPTHGALLGGLHYEFDQDGLPKYIYNSIFYLELGHPLKEIYRKKLLPNYDIFDEKKYFTPGEDQFYFQWNNLTIGTLVCEDMWPSSIHSLDPCLELERKLHQDNLKADLIVNLSAGPYHLNKHSLRLKRAHEIAFDFQCPFIYVNQVGAEDEILFDGQSFAIMAPDQIIQAFKFQQDIQVIDYPCEQYSSFLPPKTYASEKDFRNKFVENTWEHLFDPNLIMVEKVPRLQLRPWANEQCEEVLKALQFGLQEYSLKNKMNHFLIGLSGGMDSALVLAIVCLGLRPGQKVEAIYMPSKHSSSLSFDLCEQLCKNLNVNLTYIPIKFLHATLNQISKESFKTPLEGLADENVQSRMRGLLLYTRSNQTGAMVINTSNKSELAVGYTTQYGDSVGALSLLGDLYKSEVYWLAQYIADSKNGIIPQGIIDRPPTAELRKDQVDSQSLPDYDRLDAILEGLLSYRLNSKDLIQFGFSDEEVKKVFQFYYKSEYKRKQFGPIIKIKSKSFGFGYRIPISKCSEIYS